MRVGRKRVARLMPAGGLAGCRSRRAARAARREAGTPPAPDLVSRDWDRRRPDALWLADITFVPTREGWPYLASILDAHSRRVVGWSMAGHTGAELVIGALSMAVARRGPRPPGSVHHPGRGSRYTSPEFGRALKEASIPPSTGGVGPPHDNAMAESSVATLKTGLLDRRPRPTREAARGAIFEYLERFHNPRRRRSALGYASPIEDERSMMTEATAA